MMTETPGSIYDRLSLVYDGSYNEPIHRIEDEFIYGRLKELGFDRGKVLDLGFGTGSLLDNLKIEKENYRGLDISRRMIGIAQEKHPDYVFLRGSMAKIPYGDEEFDSVISLFGSFSYTRKPKQAAQEIERVLKPGGRFFIMAYGYPYRERKSYILNRMGIETPARFYSDYELYSYFDNFKNLKIQGMTWLSETLSKRLPYSLARAYHKFESNIIGTSNPDNFYFLIISGEKNA